MSPRGSEEPRAASVRLATEDLAAFFEPRHQALARDLGRIGARLAAEQAELATGREAAAALARALGERDGLYALLVPEALGGFPSGATGSPQHVDARSLCLVREMLGQVSPVADALFGAQAAAAHVVAAAAPPALRSALVPRLVSGDALVTFALSEPAAGTDLGAVATVARKDGDAFVLDGEKHFVSSAPLASHHVVFACANPSEGPRGLAAFVVEAGAPGLHVEETLIPSEHPIGALRLSGCRVPASAMLGAVGDGLRLALRTVAALQVTVGAGAVGIARRALAEAARHVRVRRQLGAPLADAPGVQDAIAGMATELDAARLLVARAAHAQDAARAPVPAAAAMAKAYATEAACSIVDRAVQLVGAPAFVRGAPLERLARAARPLRVHHGANEVARLAVGRAVIAAHADAPRERDSDRPLPPQADAVSPRPPRVHSE